MWRSERGSFTLGLNLDKRRGARGKKQKSKLPSSSVHGGAVKRSRKAGVCFFFLFPPPKRRESSPFPSFSPRRGPMAAPAAEPGRKPPRPPRCSRPRGPLRPSSPSLLEVAAAAVTCSGSRQVKPLLRRSDSQMVRQEEPQLRPQRPAPRSLRRLLASPSGSD